LGLGREQLSNAIGAPIRWFLPESLNDPNARVPATLVLALWAYLESQCPDESFGFWLSERLPAAPLSIASWVISTSPTLGEGLARSLRYQRLLHDEAHSELRVGATEAVYTHRVGAPPFRPPTAAIEFGFITFLQLAQRLTGQAIIPRRTRLRHPAPRDIARHLVCFGPSLEFSAAQDELVLERAQLELAVSGADPTLSAIVEAHAAAAIRRLPERSDLNMRVRSHIIALLSEGAPSLTTVAERMHLTRRTLQRHLRLAGTSFALELDHLRHELSLQYLADNRISLQEVAFLLGFSEVSAFHRAFRRWTGQTPVTFRGEHP
jgi:AraC-like DNA-binding protein